MECNNCGGILKLIGEDCGVKTYVCPCCGGKTEIEVKKPEIETKSFKVETKSGESVFNDNIDSIVEIYCDLGNGSMSSGSGYIISRRGEIITNTHVVADEDKKACKNVFVKINGRRYDATVLRLGDDNGGSGRGVDLALLELDSVIETKPVEFGSIEDVHNGMRVYTIGNSLGQGTCITSGIVSDRNRVLYDGKTYIMTDCSINPGNSGGALFNDEGKVVGTIVSGITNAEGMNFAIPVNTVLRFINNRY